MCIVSVPKEKKEKPQKEPKEPKEKKQREPASKLASSVKKPSAVKTSAPKDIGVSKLFEYPKI